MAGLKSLALAVWAFVLIGTMRLALTVMPYRTLARLLPQPGRRKPDGWVKTRTARAMRRAAQWPPRASCLPQALAGSVLLSLQGYACQVRIGVAPADGRAFRAHAWLLCGGDIIVGDGENLSEFVTITDLRGGPA